MNKTENLIMNRLGWTINPNPNAIGSQQPDAWDLQNRTHQIGANHKTMGNTCGYILTNDIVADFTQLLKEDASEFLTLYLNHDKEGEWVCSYSETDAIEFFTENPDLLYYDTKDEQRTLRIKCLKTKIRKYMAASTFKERL